MNILRIGRNVTIIALLLSLLFHVGTILYIFMQKKASALTFEEQHQELTNIQQQNLQQQINQPQQNPWAETKGRASNFGTPIFFQDEPSFNFAETKASNSDDESMEDKTKKIFASDMAQISDDETNLEHGSEENNIQQEDDTTQENNSAQEDSIENNIVDLDKEILSALAQLDQPQSKQTTHPIKRTTTGKKRARKKRINKTTNNNPFASTSPQKKSPLSLAQLTQGFLNHLNTGGTHAVSMMGKKGGVVTQEQLKYERYLQKLGWCLQNSYNINSDHCPAIPQDTQMHVYLSVNRDGTVKDLRITQSSRNLHFDAFTLSIFRDASSSFPPVPNYLTVDPFTVTYLITVGASDGKNMRFYFR